MIDDLITTGKNLIGALTSIRGEGGTIKDGLVLIDRQEGGVEKLKQMNVTVHSFMKISDLAKKLFDIGILDKYNYEEIMKQINESVDK